MNDYWNFRIAPTMSLYALTHTKDISFGISP